MEFNFGPVRLLILALCLGGFAWWGGFSPPQNKDRQVTHVHGVRDVWIKCTLMFVAGAVCVSLVDHRVGLMDPTHLRPVYVILGLFLMIGAVIWLQAVKHATGEGLAMAGVFPSTQTSHQN